MRSLLSLIYRHVAVRGPVELGVNVHVGPGSRVWAPSKLQVEDHVYIGKFVTIECNGRVGAGTIIGNNVGLIGRSDHEANQVGRLMRFSSWVGDAPHLETSIDIGRDCWIGFGSIILGSVSVGDSTVVAAGSIVTRDLPENSICMGTPAQPVRPRFSQDEYLRHKRALNQEFES